MASSLLPLLLCSLILLPFCVLAQTRSQINVGDSLKAESSNSTWVVSPSGDFAFGFLPLTDTDLFILCIWYAKIPDKTIIWYANTDNPTPKDSKVELNANDGLVLTAPDGNQLWKTQGLSVGVANGVINDTGNFVLRDGNSNSVYETFKDRRDTLLPSQILEKGGKLSSRLMETNFSKGRFELVFQNDGNLVMHSINLPSGYANENYYESKTVESNTSSPGTQLVFDSFGNIYILRKNNEKYNFSEVSGVSTTQFYLRATLNFDGVFTLYQHPKSSSGNQGWTSIWSQPDNICSYNVNSGSGVCGYNSFCTLGDDKRPTCQCPKRYSLLDPNDPYGSCKPDFIMGCAEDELSNRQDLYEFEVLINTDWPLADYVLQSPFTEDECRQSCMEDCMCAVAIFRLGDHCWKKKLPLSNGKVDATLNGAKAFIKVRKDNSSFVVPTIIVNKNRSTLIMVGSFLLGSSAFLNLILIVAICLSTSFIFQYKKKLRRVSKSDTVAETNLRCFTYEELEEATNGFDKELGRGAFGIVYEGVINIGSTTRVAVKKLNTFLLDEVQKEFKNELNVIGLTHHKNLVRLLGFCEAEEERLLVYEYMSNGTLASFLFNGEKPSWKLRLQIAFGIARGLRYLHEECNTQIIHCDIKPQNILLDDYFNARISDFGLAKLLKMNQSRTNTGIRGTKGYVAIEWFRNMPITAKVDVYSYGVLLLEIIACRKNVEMEIENEGKAILTDWACDCYADGNLAALVENDKEALDDKKNLERLVMIAIWCVQEDPCLRPTMGNVTQMLEGVVEVQVPPCPAPISIQYSLD
ncbi:G-type lectin S-receptor-like serine/threonine-protein kinase LECRK3 [Gastrolobium bilobum]|uniref:G-type lectin S-receptor-like serine/threonine-protein kinase LECRK3 n=1 Tax=Gastrolobium bilobum TaxID=150636 RepID=UPI002AAF2C05|nr:G-type lectin S-receptor-like serine/threonine-protein kinase LECRK3 [Gastrolobium bilobum]